MAKVQSRRSISFSAADFEAARLIAERLKVPLAQLAGQALRELADRRPEAKEIALPRPIAARVVIDDLRPDSPFRASCQLAGCGAVPGQACWPVPKDGGPDPELEVSAVHENRRWQVVGADRGDRLARTAEVVVTVPPAPAPTVTLTPPSVDPAELQRLVDERVGVLPRPKRPEPFALPVRPPPGQPIDDMPLHSDALHYRRPEIEPFTIDDARRIVAEVSAPDYQAPALDPTDPIARAIAASSVGQGLANIAENGIDAELEDLEQDLADHPEAGEVPEVQVVYDDDRAPRDEPPQPRRPAGRQRPKPGRHYAKQR